MYNFKFMLDNSVTVPCNNLRWTINLQPCTASCSGYSVQNLQWLVCFVFISNGNVASLWVFFLPMWLCDFVVKRQEWKHVYRAYFPQETQQIPTEDVALDICLSNGQKVTVNILTSDQTEDVLDVSKVHIHTCVGWMLQLSDWLDM